MAINKKFIHFKTFENFNSKKLSANEENNKYTLGVDGEIQTGAPEILYQSICYIKDIKKQWTHGSLYNCSDNVDFASDLTGVLEATPEEFTFRTSAGTKSIRDESAVIRRIKGNTSVWGQKLQSIPTRENFEGCTTFYDSSTNECVIQNISRTTPYSSGSTRWQIKPDLYPIVGHKYAIFSDRYYKGVGVYINNVFHEVNTIFEADNSSVVYFRLNKTFDFTNTCPVGSEVRLRINIVDLTELYSAGNEPTTLEEFKELYPESYYPYCEPEVRSMRATGIETIGANAFDKDSVVGGLINADGSVTSNDIYSVAKIEVVPYEKYTLTNVANAANTTYTYALYDSEDRFISVGEIKNSVTKPVSVSGDVTMPMNARYMRVVVHNDYLDSCCVNLKHSGTLTAEEAVYFKEVRMLPEIATYFPDGMQGIGDVYDEINEENAVKRFGVVDLGTLTWRYDSTYKTFYTLERIFAYRGKTKCAMYEQNDSHPPQMLDKQMSLSSYYYLNAISIKDLNYTDAATFKTAMSGVMLVYELIEPIVTPLTEPLQLDYKVADFGTEKMLSDLPSSPFRADIVYQFNAEGRIRDNSRNIERLENNTKEIANIANEAYELIGDKQSELISGVNIKTINGESILGEGDLQINTGEDNIQSDWNVTDTTSDAYIKNKPTIPKVDSTLSTTSKNAISNSVVTNALNAKGTYTKPNDGIPKSDLSSEVQQSLEKANTAVQVQGPDEIWYTTSDGNVTYGYFDYNGEDYYVSNTYSNGFGIMKFKYPIPYIKDNAFENNSTLTSIILPEGVTSIGSHSFFNTPLRSVDLPQSCTTIGDNAFSDCVSLDNIDLSNITVFGDYAFKHSCLQSVKFSSFLLDLPYGVFQWCTGLKNVILPDNLEIIEGTAFLGTAISSIIIPKTVTNIGDEAFTNCPELKEIYFQSEVCPEIGDRIFDINISDRKIYVPASALNTYKTTLYQYLDNILAYVDSNNLKTINGTSLIGTGDISINTSGTVDLSGYYTKTEIDNKGYLTNIPSEYITETELAAKKYATTTALNNKQDKLVSGTNIKTINGASLLGSGNLSITTGEENVQSDWLENNSTDAHIKNRTHYITGTKITSAGTYTVSRSQIYFEGNIYNLELGVKTTLKSGPYVYATLTTATNLKIEDANNYIAAYPVIAITSIKKLDDAFISDNIVRNDALKTINGESIVGSGNIEITSGASGTITEVKANGTSISTSGVANIPAASTSAYGVTKLSSSTSSTSTTLAATASAVKAAYDLANGKQAKLTSGTNIMTARGQSILTSGDLFDPIIISTNVVGTQQTLVGKCYVYSVPQNTAKTFVLAAPSNFWNDSINIIIKTSASITFNSSNIVPILWANGTTPTFDSDKVYEISFRYTPLGWLGVAVAFYSA